MAAAPSFAATPRAAVVSIATANTARDGTGTIGTVLTAGASGSKVEEVRICPAVTTTAGVVRLYLHDGTTAHLLDEVAITAQTLSGTVAANEYVLSFDNLVLPSGWSLRASTDKAETFKVFAFGGDF